MLLKSDILRITDIQQKNFVGRESGIDRELADDIISREFKLLILTGNRYSGKTSLLFQLYKKKYNDAQYINFGHPRFYNLDTNDLFKLDEIIEEKGSRVLFFDDIQYLDNWNDYLRQKLDEGYTIVITANDSSVIYSDIYNGFTGLYLVKELFPFSFSEFCRFKNVEKNEESVKLFITEGGFPGYLKSGAEDFTTQLFDDLLVRDIAVNYGIRDIRGLKRLAVHLLSNIGKLITGNQLKQILGIKTTTTVIDYMSAFEERYLFFYLPKFSYSVRKQMINPRKVYAVDTGLVSANSLSFDDNSEQLLENLVFLHLRKLTSEIAYYSENNSCDFVVTQKNRVSRVIQVCTVLRNDNLGRELDGLFEAMEYFDLQEGTIVTMNQTDRFERDGKTVNVIPFYSFE